MKIITLSGIKLLFLLSLFISQVAWAQDKFEQNISKQLIDQLEKAKSFALNKNYDEAIKRYQKILAQQKNYFAAHYNLGIAYADTGKYSQAIESLETAKKLRETENLKDATIYNSLGWAYMLNADYDKAEQNFNLGLQNKHLLTPQSLARLHNNLGTLYLYTGKVAPSRRQFEESKKAYNNNNANANLRNLDQIEMNVKKRGIESSSKVSPN